MPIGSASAQVSSRAANESTTVIHRRSPSTSATGRCHSIDSPKSPCSSAARSTSSTGRNRAGRGRRAVRRPSASSIDTDAAVRRQPRDVGVDEIAGRQLDDDEGQHRDRPHRGDGRAVVGATMKVITVAHRSPTRVSIGGRARRVHGPACCRTSLRPVLEEPGLRMRRRPACGNAARCRRATECCRACSLAMRTPISPGDCADRADAVLLVDHDLPDLLRDLDALRLAACWPPTRTARRSSASWDRRACGPACRPKRTRWRTPAP